MLRADGLQLGLCVCVCVCRRDWLRFVEGVLEGVCFGGGRSGWCWGIRSGESGSREGCVWVTARGVWCALSCVAAVWWFGGPVCNILTPPAAFLQSVGRMYHKVRFFLCMISCPQQDIKRAALV